MRIAYFWTFSVGLACLFPSIGDADWNRFRGNDGSGSVAEGAITKNISASENLRWRMPLPGSGTSSPVISGDRVYLTAYTGYGLDMQSPGDPKALMRHLIAFDRKSGEELWRASVAADGEVDPYQGFICQHGYASTTPTTDGQHVYVIFGKSGLIKFDLGGNEVWRTSLGKLSDPAKWGDGSSPILYNDLVIANASVLGRKLVAIEKQTGQERWSITDESFTNAWSTPVVVSTDAGDRILFAVPGQVIAVDPGTGEKVWYAETPIKDAVCASLLVGDGRVYIMGGRNGQGMSIRMGGQGDVTDSHVEWERGIRSGIVTPVASGDQMYWCSGGIFYAANLATGDYVYRQRLPRLGGPTGGFPNADYSSPIAVGNYILQFTRNGESYLIEGGDSFQVVSHNPGFDGDDSSFSSTPAVSDGEVFVRSEKYLYCIAKPREPSKR
jgi:outer membrane protein assembly factor BamB